ncbi:MAG: hypothetical protein JXR54_05625 [Tannerellaceae bacterium]|nr:hypothetical protein [Tannerellaceae bacterium]
MTDLWLRSNLYRETPNFDQNLYLNGKNHAVPSFSGRKKHSAKETGLGVRPELRRVTPTKLYRRAVMLNRLCDTKSLYITVNQCIMTTFYNSS